MLKVTEFDNIIWRMNQALKLMYSAVIENNYDRFERGDELYCKASDRVTDKMIADKKDAKRYYDCEKKFFQLRANKWV